MNKQDIDFKTNLQNNIGLIKAGIWNGTAIDMSYGGTGTKLIPIQGGIVITSDKTMGILSSGSVGQLLAVSDIGIPTWSNLSDLLTITGEVTTSGFTATVTNSAVIGKVLTGYTSGAGTVVATDTILQAIQKLNGNAGGAAAAGTLTGATLASNVLTSSLTSVGTLADLTVTNTITGSITGNAATATNVAYSGLTGTVPTWNQNTTGSATTAGTVTTAAQPTITSVGTLTSLTTSSNITFTEPNGTSLFGLGNGFDLTNVALGNALQNCTPDASTGDGQYNLGIGAGSLYAITTGTSNTAIGSNSLLYGATCSQNIAIGTLAMGGNPSTPQTGTGYDIAIGNSSCNNLTTNTNVIGIGRDSFYYLSTGNSNVALGLNAGKFAISTTALTNTANSIYIGGNSKASAASGNTNEIAIGSTALGLGSNTVVLGNTSITNTYLRGDINLAAGKKIIDSTVQSLTSQNASGTGVSPTIQVICPSAAFALLNQTTTQPVFNTPQDTISLQAATTYMFEGQYLLQTGTTSHTTTISFVSSIAATAPSIAFTTIASMHSSANASTRVQETSFFASILGGIVYQAGVLPNTIISFKGIVRTTDAGNLVPNLLFSVAPGVGANFVLVGSYLNFYPIGSNTIDSVGTAIG